MTAVCHRCGADLSLNDDTHFCPHCGAPQLLLSSALAEAADDAGAAPTAPPPLIAWRTALQAALLVTAGAMLLFAAAIALPPFSLAFLLWVGSGSLLTLELYRRQNGHARIDAAIGARIGASVGVLLVGGLGSAVAVTVAVARFGLHRMGHFDAEMQGRIVEQVQAAIAANPAAAELAQGERMPEFVAGSVLLGLGMAAGFLFLISVAGGAVGGLLRERRPAALS